MSQNDYESILAKYEMAQKIAEEFRYNTNLDVVINSYAVRLKEISKQMQKK